MAKGIMYVDNIRVEFDDEPTPLMNAASTSRNTAFWLGVLPGEKRFLPVSVESDQLTCLPEPLTPAKGFSCSRHTRLWRSATFFIVSMTSWFWSLAVLASV